MNRKEYKKSMSGIHPSEQVVERIIDMSNENTKKRIKFAPVIALVACLAILITGAFGGSAISAKLNPVKEMFVITAYANDEIIELKENEMVKSSLKLTCEIDGGTGDVDGVVTDYDTSFVVDGKNIATITYSSDRGSFDYQSENPSKEEIKYGNEDDYSSKITLKNIDNKVMKVFYNPEDAIDTLLEENNASYDCSNLPQDTITVDVEYKNGKTEQQKVNVSFDKDGYMLMEYIK